MTVPIILASGSAIRRQIMYQAGLEFEVISKPIDEAAIKLAMLDQKRPLPDIADALAEAKSRRVSQAHPGLVIGADQIMVMDKTLFDKPKDLAEARDRLRLMRGQTHYLIGAIVICENGMPVWRNLTKTKLTMRQFSDEYLDDYLSRESEYVTKTVGAYRFEGLGAQLFSAVEGDFFSILGLNLLPLLDYLRERKAVLS